MIIMESVGSVNKGKKVYGKPMLIAEEFVPNEYVAACFMIACDYGLADSPGGSFNQAVTGECRHSNDKHQREYCGTASKQAIVVNGKLPDLDEITVADLQGQVTIVEVDSADDGANLSCEITGYDASTHTIHWTNRFRNNSSMYFCHKGVVNLDESNRVNHS